MEYRSYPHFPVDTAIKNFKHTVKDILLESTLKLIRNAFRLEGEYGSIGEKQGITPGIMREL